MGTHRGVPTHGGVATVRPRSPYTAGTPRNTARGPTHDGDPTQYDPRSNIGQERPETMRVTNTLGYRHPRDPTQETDIMQPVPGPPPDGKCLTRPPAPGTMDKQHLPPGDPAPWSPLHGQQDHQPAAAPPSCPSAGLPAPGGRASCASDGWPCIQGAVPCAGWVAARAGPRVDPQEPGPCMPRADPCDPYPQPPRPESHVHTCSHPGCGQNETPLPILTHTG